MKKCFIGITGVGLYDSEFPTVAKYWFNDEKLADQAIDLLEVKKHAHYSRTWPEGTIGGVKYIEICENVADYEKLWKKDFSIEEVASPEDMLKKEVVVPAHYEVIVSAENGAMTCGRFATEELAKSIASKETGYWGDKGHVNGMPERKYNVITSMEEFLALITPSKEKAREV